jgi:hypothetical protein
MARKVYPLLHQETMPSPPSLKTRAFMLLLRWRIQSRNLLSTHPTKPAAILDLFRAAVGPGAVLAGWQVMTSTAHERSYSIGLIVIYFGFAFCLVECTVDPVLRARPWLRFPMTAIAIALAWLFTTKVVLVKAPINFDAYAMRNGEYPAGTKIAGIPWNDHFTDLRVWIKNSTDYDYSDVYLEVQPDQWNYRAALVGDSHGCTIASLGGNALLVNPHTKGGATKVTTHNESGHFDASDNVGDMFEPFLTQGGYRLECQGKLPAQSEIQIVFALAVPDPRLAKSFSQEKPSPGTWGVGVAELTPTDIFNTLGPRPPTSLVTINGHYKLGPKEISIQSHTVLVGDGN